VEFEWDPGKAADNRRKHGVRFAEAVTVFEDDAMLTMPDDIPEEERFAAIGMGSLGRILVVIFTTRGDRVRIISARKATRTEQASTREEADEKRIRLPQGAARSGRAPNSRKDENHDSARQ